MRAALELISMFPHYLVDWIGCFLVSRRERLFHLLLGIPAILVALTVVYVAKVSPVRSASIVQSLAEEAVRALEEDDLDRVNFLITRIRSSGRIPAGLECALALKYEEQGDAEKAARLMKSVAREMVPERPEALKWLAIRILEGNSETEDLHVAEDYLDSVIKQKPNDAQGHWLLAQVFVRAGKLEEATKHLDLLAPYDYRASLLNAEVYRKLGHTGQARFAVEQTLKLLDKLPAEELTAGSARARGECLFYLQRDQEAAEVFQAALETYQDNSFKLPLYIAYLRQASKVKESDEKLDILGKALELAPGNPLILAQISQIALQEPEKSAVAVERLESALQQGLSTAAMHFVLGTNASQTGQSSTAIEHLRKALEAKEVAPVYGPPAPAAVARFDQKRRKTELSKCSIKNNLAWTLAHSESPNFEEALRLANEVCEQFPEVHTFRETRGQIHARMSHWKEAIADLSFALEGMPKYSPLHVTLAQAYRATGNKYGAQRHTRLAEETKQPVH